MLPILPGLITSGDFMREYMSVIEDCGVESVWGAEHVAVIEGHDPEYPYNADGRLGDQFPTRPMPSALELLAFVAGISQHVKLGTAVMIAPLHSPAVLAKRVATVDTLSGGRVVLGLGIGWQREEYEAVGVPFRDRGERLEECVLAMRALWTDSPATFRGTHTSFEKVFSHPQPERGSVPILLGGNSAAVIDRVGRIGDGWLPYTIGPDEVAASVARMRDVATRAGRDPDALDITAWPGSHDPTSEHDVAYVRHYVEAGARRIILWPSITTPDGLPALRAQLERYTEEVIGRL